MAEGDGNGRIEALGKETSAQQVQLDQLREEIRRIRDGALKPVQVLGPGLSAIGVVVMLIGAVGGLFVNSLDSKIASLASDITELKTAQIPRGELNARIEPYVIELRRLLERLDALEKAVSNNDAQVRQHAIIQGRFEADLTRLRDQTTNVYSTGDVIREMQDRIDRINERLNRGGSVAGITSPAP